jgi:hypothetical protein
MRWLGFGPERVTRVLQCHRFSSPPTRQTPLVNAKVYRAAIELVRATLAVILIISFPITSTSATPRPAKDLELGPGFTKEFSSTIDDLLQAVQQVLADNIIHGTLIYDKQPVLDGAKPADSTAIFAAYTGTGKVFYKVRPEAIAPRHFLESADQGTIAVRYIVTTISPERTRLHIDALYVEKTHRTVHISDGTVEASEGKAIEDRLNAIQFTEQESADADRRRESAELVKETQARQRVQETTLLEQTQTSVQDLEQQITALRHQVERRVKAPGTQMKAAPFAVSASMATLPAYTELLVVIVTPHWYGVETPDGHRGWLPVEQLEPLP